MTRLLLRMEETLESVVPLQVSQRGSDIGEYKLIAKQGNNTDDLIIDSNVVGVICPMYFKIESYVEPTLAVVTSKGNVELV